MTEKTGHPLDLGEFLGDNEEKIAERNAQSFWLNKEQREKFHGTIPVKVVENDHGNVTDDMPSFDSAVGQVYIEWLTSVDASERPDKSFGYFEENVLPCLRIIRDL